MYLPKRVRVNVFVAEAVLLSETVGLPVDPSPVAVPDPVPVTVRVAVFSVE
jgi:hypothetical protein